MGETLKVLGQSSPAANTLTDLYTVPALTQVACSSIAVCNQTAAPIKFRVSVAVAGAADATKQYLYFDVTLGKNDTFLAVLGISLGAADVVRVQADAVNVSFNLFGAEVTS